jgi:DNA-binding LytR/AlgR family response regulator
LLQFHFKASHKIEIKEFGCGEDIVEEYNSGIKFEVIFLDIEMKEMDGLQVAHLIRNTDTDAIIVFLTNHPQFVYHSFKIEAFDYLVKPLSKIIFDEMFARVLNKYQKQHFQITIKIRDSISTIQVKEIVYIECFKHHLTFHLKSETIECTGKLQEYEATLTNHGFLRCHNSILINAAYIKTINDYDITTIFNDRVDMSLRKRQYCLSCYNKYIARYHA